MDYGEEKEGEREKRKEERQRECGERLKLPLQKRDMERQSASRREEAGDPPALAKEGFWEWVGLVS